MMEPQPEVGNLAKPWIAFIILISFAIFCGSLVWLPHAPTVDATIIGIILGVLGSNSTSVVQYYFGNSASGETTSKTLSSTMTQVQNGMADRIADNVKAHLNEPPKSS